MKLPAIRIFLLLIAIGVLPACDQSTSTTNDHRELGSQQTLEAEDRFVISGVSSKGPIRGATINIYAMDANGNKTGNSLATTTTDNNGFWSVSLNPAPTEILLVESSNGNYVDEADPSTPKRTIDIAANEILEGVIFPGQSTSSITLLTDALLEKSRNESTSTNIQVVLANNRNNAISGLGFDPFGVAAANPLAPSAGASVDAIEYAMYLGGVATALNTAAIVLGEPVPNYGIMMGLVRDLSDGRLDGQDKDGSFSVNIDGVDRPFPAGINLNQAILRFRNNNFSAYESTPVSAPVQVSEAAIAQPGTNTFPVAIDDATTTPAATPVTINVTNNDSDADGDALTTSIQSQAANGTLSSAANGVFVYTPNTGFSGADSFEYNVSDGKGGSDTARVTISVLAAPAGPGTAVNVPPTADAGATQSVPEQTLVSLSGTASDVDGSVASVAWTQTGTGPGVVLSGQTTTSPTFTAPSVSALTFLQFTLTVTDDQGATAADTVSVVVTPVNAAPTADAGADQVVPEQTSVTLTSGAGSNDPDGSISSFQWTQLSGTSISASLTGADTASASFTTPTLSSTEVLLFALTVTDNEGLIGVDTVSVIVTPVNAAPSANAGADQIVNELTPVTLTGISSDADGSVASVQWTQLSGTDVSASFNGANTDTFSFTSPLVLLNSTDILVFQYQATDNEGLVAADFVTVIVNPVAVSPVANAGLDQTANELTPVTLDGTLSSDDISISTYDWVQLSPASPLAVLSDTAAVSPTFTVPDIANDTVFTFQLTVTDNEGGVASDTVVINAISDNLGPTGVDDVATTTEDTPVVITNLLANDTDPNGNNTPFALATVTQPANGTVVIEANGTDVTYTPNLNFNGADTFTYTSTDSLGANSVNSAAVTVTVTQVNDNPVANADSASTIQAFALTLSNLLDNDTDPENDTLSLSGIASQPANGTVVNNGDGTLTYTPLVAFAGDDSFTYSIVDGNGGSAIGSVTITVVPDTDGDGVVNAQELIDGTFENLADSDGDGFYDGHEKLVGTNPLLNTSIPPTTTISAANLNNVISVDTTWGLIDSPYLVTSDVTIQSGATLTIEPGVVVKFADGIDIFVNTNGAIHAVGNVAAPQHVVFTSDDDDSINGDTNGNAGASVPAHGNWQGIDFQQNSDGTLQYASVKYAATCIDITNSQPVLDNLDIGDCSGFGILFGNGIGTRNVNLSNIEIIDFNGDGTSTGIDGIQITSSSNGITNLAVSNITITEPGDSAFGEHGLNVIGINNGIFTGSIDNVSITNAATDAFNLVNQGSGNMTIALSNLTANGAGVNSLDVRRTSTGPLSLTFDGANSFSNSQLTASGVFFQNNDPDFLATSTNVIDGAGHALNLDASNGSFRNFTFNNAAIAGLLLQQGSVPAVFDNVVVTNAPTPYELVGSSITPTIIAGYDYSDASVAKTHVRIGSTFTNDMDLAPDPLGVGSVYRVVANIIVNSGATFSIQDGVIVKFNLNTSLTVNGGLTIGDGDGAGTDVVLTSFRDNGFGANISDGVGPVRGDWDRINVGAGASVSIDNALIRYGDYGLYQSYVAPASPVTISNSTIELTDFHGIFLGANNGDGTALEPITWNLDAVTFFDIGRDNRFNGIDIDADADSHISGVWTNLTMNLVRGSGIFIDDATSGTVNPTIAGLTMGNTDTIGLYGIELVGDATTAPIFTDTVNGVLIGSNTISGGLHNLFLNGVSGSYADLVLSGASRSALYFENNVSPTLWDNASIILDNSPSPYTLFGTNLPSIATIPISYTVGSAALVQDFVRLYGSLTTDLTLTANPLGAGTYYLVTQNTNLTVPNTRRLTIQEGTVIKFDASRFLQVQSGGLLLVNGTSGNPVIMTSASDNVIGDPVNSLANVSDWEGVSFEAGSAGAINFLHTWYGRDGVRITNSSPSINDLTVNYSHEGVRINGTTGASPSFTNLAINECTSTHLYLEGANLNPAFSGVLTITDIEGANGVRGIYTSSASIFTISGFEITGSNNGIELENGSVSTRFDGNVIRQASLRGILHQADGNPWIRNNVIVNNGTNSTGGGIFVSTGNGIIFGNLIRDNRASSGGGIYVSGGDPVISNNLIIENLAFGNSTSNSGGSGIYVSGSASPQIKNNTIAFNTSSDTLNEGAGITIENSTGTITLIDNITFGNTDGNAAAHDIYQESGSVINNNNLIGTILNSGANLFTANLASDIIGDPLFTDGWYLSEPIAQGVNSPANDQGSVLSSAVTPFDLAALTTRTDGVPDDGSGADGAQVNIGYHYPGPAPIVSPLITNTIVSPSAVAVNSGASGATVVMTITPRDDIQVELGVGLDVIASTPGGVNDARLGQVIDLGNGSYQVSYLTPTSSTGQDTISFTVNGVLVQGQTVIDWSP